MTGLSRHEVEQVSEMTVEKTLTKLGINISTPEDVRRFQQDMIFLRNNRRGSEKLVDWTKRSVLTAAITGLLAALAAGVMAIVQRGGH